MDRVKINSCTPRDLESIPGVGRKTVDLICNIREAEGNITPETFATLGVRNLPAAMESIDFEQWAPAGARHFGSPTLPSNMSTGPSYPSMSEFYATAGRPSQYQPGEARPEPGYGYPPRATGIHTQDPNYSWRWGQFQSTPKPVAPQQYQPGYKVKSEPDDRTDGFATSMHEQRTEPKFAPKVYVPKGITYNGKDDWPAFISKFTSYADREGWNAKTRREVLCWVLEGAASKFYANVIKRNPTMDYFEVVDKLAKRFDIKDLPETTQMLFSSSTQNPKESLIEWCDRISTMATQAFPDWTDEQITRQTVMQFCKGCADKEAGFHAINRNPKTLEEAVDQIKRFQQSSVAIYGKAYRGVRQVEEEEEDIIREARATKFENRRRPQWTPDSDRARTDDGNPSTLERVEGLEQNMALLTTTMKKMEKSFKSLETRMSIHLATDLAKPPKKTQSSQADIKPKRVCFGCGEEGHFKDRCPRRRHVREMYEGEDDDEIIDDEVTDEYREGLNEEGSGY